MKSKSRISIFGLGYVGCVLAACFAKKKFQVVGVDVDPIKVKAINSGHSPIFEPRLDFLISESVKKGRLKATDDVDSAIVDSDISMVCVGTPSLPNGDINYAYIEKVINEIAVALLKKKSRHIIVVRSTILPGTMDSIIKPILLNVCGEKIFQNIELCHNPEFLREGSAISDFLYPPKTVIGAYKKKTGRYLMSLLYGDIPGKKIVTDICVAETVKYVDNTFHALKVAFANEIGIFCKFFNIDSGKVMEIFCRDKKLNLSAYYLKPGKPFGGSCLPKDLKGLVYKAKKNDLELPVIYNILPSNNIHTENILKFIISFGKKNIGIVGLSFKENTDDLRNSPLIGIAESLIGRGYKLSIFDKNVSGEKIFGANRRYLVEHIPHVFSLFVNDLSKLIQTSEIIVLANKEEEFRDLAGIVKNKIIIDLAGMSKETGEENYYKVC